MTGRHGFEHSSLLYAGEDDFLAGVVPFVVEGVAAGEPVLVAVSTDRIEALRAALGEPGAPVMFADMRRLGSNPGRIIPAWHRFLSDFGNSDAAVRGVGEPIWAGRSDDEVVECERHEELLNVAFSHLGPFHLLCPYDTASLPQAVIDNVWRTHPSVIADGERRSSRSFPGVASLAAPVNDHLLPPPPSGSRAMAFSAASLRELRQLVTDIARAAGLGAAAQDDATLAVHELATNSVRHGGGRGVLTGWNDAQSVIFEVRDAGVISDPLAGRQEPDVDRVGGRGLWLANQLCDLVQIRRSPSGGVVRVHMRLPRSLS